MNKAELIKAVSEASGQNSSTVKSVLDGLEALVGGELAMGNEVTLPGIGKLKTSTRDARTCRNPKTGEPVEIEAKTVVKFSAAKALKDAVA